MSYSCLSMPLVWITYMHRSKKNLKTLPKKMRKNIRNKKKWKNFFFAKNVEKTLLLVGMQASNAIAVLCGIHHSSETLQIRSKFAGF